MAKFEIYLDRSGGYRWRLKATNGEIIAVSESYTTFYAVQQSILTVKRLVPLAAVVTI